MEVGILSFNNSINYGAILQIFALKKTFENLGVSVKIIDYLGSHKEFTPMKLTKSIESRGLIKGTLIFLYSNLVIKKSIVRRSQIFLTFKRTCLNIDTDNGKPDELFNCDILVCGSDQIWNPEITKGFNPVYFGIVNHPRIKKKFSYAASVGDISLISTSDRKEEFLSLIKNLDGISVRENDLSEFISNNTDIRPIVSLDPTLLLDPKDYEEIESSCIIQDKYLLVYQLQKNDQMVTAAKCIARERRIKIIIIENSPHRPYLIRRNCLYYLSPAEFITYFRKADFVITNSFHGTVFSIIFQKCFFVFASENRNYRIINLLQILGLEDRYITSHSWSRTQDRKIDFFLVQKRLESERKKSFQYLSSIINMGDFVPKKI